jgi:hypothetical protein
MDIPIIGPAIGSPAAASVTQPAAGNAILVVAATTVGAPGTIYVVPEVLAT